LAAYVVFDLPADSIKAVSGDAQLSEIITLPLRVAAGQKIAYLIEEGMSPPHNLQSNVKWKLVDAGNPTGICRDGIKFVPGDLPAFVVAKNGYLVAQENTMKVTKIYEIFGDVTARMGVLETDDPVIVHGGVHQGSKIVCGADVEIQELIEEAEIQATGSIVAKGGIAGGGVGRLSAGRNIYCQFVQQATLEAQGGIVVDGSIMSSEILCGKKLVIRKNGFLVGGHARVFEGIDAVKVGSEGALTTEIELGANPFKKVLLDRTKKELKDLESGRETIITATTHINNEERELLGFDMSDRVTALFKAAEVARDTYGEIEPDRLEKLNKFGSGLMRIMRMDNEIREKKDYLEKIGKEELWFDKAQLKVSKIAHPGTVITIRGVTMRLGIEHERAVFYYDKEKGEVAVSYR